MKYNCYGLVSGTKYLGQVEADSEEEALLLAEKLPGNHVSVCHQCAHEVSDPEIFEISVEVEN